MGNEAERRAAKFLEALGFTILDRNYTCRLGELDLVCDERGTLCFVEVRMRSSSRQGFAIESISPEKRRRICLAAQHYLHARAIEDRACRFDVVTVDGEADPRLIRDAFREESGEL